MAEMSTLDTAGESAGAGLKELVSAYERQLILEALDRTGGNQRRAAAVLGCLPTTLNEKMRRLGIRDGRPATATDHPPVDVPSTASHDSP